MVKLKSTNIKQTRLELLEQQQYKCAICGFECTLEQAVLDHAHREGHIRAVLHRGCNALLGRCENNAPRYGIKLEQLIAFLTGASKYLDLHRSNQTGLIHPSYFTLEEKAERRKAKAKRARLKAKALKLATKSLNKSKKEN